MSNSPIHVTPVPPPREVVTVPLLLGGERYKRGLIKCRLIHMDGRSFVQPDVLLSCDYRRQFFAPKFFYANQCAFFPDPDNNFCRFWFATEENIALHVGFFAREKIRTCSDGSVWYRCYFMREPSARTPSPSGVWRESGLSYELKLYHHTNDAGYAGITRSREMWGSRRNIQGNLWLNNIGYGYFTSVGRIRNEADLNHIAMSSSGLTGFVPTNAPYHPYYAHLVPIPKETIAARARTLSFWIDADLMAPNHLWRHVPMDRPAYYEVVLPKVFRVGLRVGANVSIAGDRVTVADADRRIFEYVIVGDGDTHAGLQAPFHEEETTSVGMVERLSSDQEIIECWKRKENSDQFNGRTVEYADLKPELLPLTPAL